MEKKRQLLIVDKIPSTLPQKQVGNAWDILGLGLTREELEYGLSDLTKNREDLRILNSTPWADKAASKVRKFIVPLLDSLPERRTSTKQTLGSLLAEPNRPNNWWFLAISEKSPIRSLLIQELYYLALIQAATKPKKYNIVQLMLENKNLREVVAGNRYTLANRVSSRISNSLSIFGESIYWLRAMRAVLQVGYINIIASLLRWRNEPAAGDSVIFTVFPSWWINCTSRSASDRFFPTKPKTLFGTYPKYWAWWSSNFRKTWTRRKIWKKILSKHKITLLQQHVPISELLALFSPILFSKLIKFRKNVGKCGWSPFLGFKIDRLLEKEFSRSIAASDLINNRLIYSATKRLATLVPPSEVVFRFEGQPVDYALIHATKGITSSVGYWHSAFVAGPNYLPLLPKCNRNREKPFLKSQTPNLMPDVFITHKGIGSRSLSQIKVPKKRIKICEPLRTHRVHLMMRKKKIKSRNHKASTKNPKPVFFLAASVDEKENTGLICCFNKCLKKLSKIRIIIKPHPAKSISNKLISLLKKNEKIKTVKIATNTNYLKKLIQSDVLISGGSTLIFEAIALGVPTIVFESPAHFAATSMKAFAKSIFIVQSAEEMLDKIQACLGNSNTCSKKNKAQPFLLKNVFGR